ncbi:MAG: hypothetical protein ABJA02_07465 [Acidobacteriota bacterium]
MIKTFLIVFVAITAAFGFWPANSVKSAANGVSAVLPLPTPHTAAANEVCPDPAAPCDHRKKHFDAWELPFHMPAQLTPNKTYSSAPFYAVMFKTFDIEDDCDGGEFVIAVEKERKKVQKREPGRKVFASYQCPNMGAVDYDFTGRYDAKRENILIDNFLAIYAGTARSDADRMLKTLISEYPNAVIKKMTATFEVVDQ